MDAKQPSTTSAVQSAGIGERLVHIESRMDFVATREDVALVRTEIGKTNAQMAELKADLLTGIAEVKTLVANREASMQRYQTKNRLAPRLVWMPSTH